MKRDFIKKYYDLWERGQMTYGEIALLLDCSTSYVETVLRGEREYRKFELKKKLQDEAAERLKHIIEPAFNWEDSIENHKQKKVILIPKVTPLPNGKVEVIYQSKINL